MPRYDYACSECGAFVEWRPMSEAADPAPCPACGAASPRVIGAPQISTLSGATRSAQARNEKSAERPTVASPSGHRHHGACGCGHGAKRPWMLGH